MGVGAGYAGYIHIASSFAPTMGLGRSARQVFVSYP